MSRYYGYCGGRGGVCIGSWHVFDVKCTCQPKDLLTSVDKRLSLSTGKQVLYQHGLKSHSGREMPTLQKHNISKAIIWNPVSHKNVLLWRHPLQSDKTKMWVHVFIRRETIRGSLRSRQYCRSRSPVIHSSLSWRIWQCWVFPKEKCPVGILIRWSSSPSL